MQNHPNNPYNQYPPQPNTSPQLPNQHSFYHDQTQAHQPGKVPPPPPVQQKPQPKFVQWFKAQKKPVQWLTGCLGILVLCSVCGLCSTALATTAKPQTQTSPTQVAQAAQSQPTTIPTQKPLTLTPAPKKLAPTPALSHYPPKTSDDLHVLASKGDPNKIQGFHSESVGLTGVCPQPKREVTVDPNVTGQRLAEDLLAYFYSQGVESPCGSIVFVYHTQGEADTIGTYTAGRIKLDVADSSGQDNVDPNGSNLKYTLTLDIGGFGADQEYVVTYTK